MPFELTEEELELLTPEERAGLKDDEHEDDDEGDDEGDELDAEQAAAAAAAKPGDADAEAKALADAEAERQAEAAKALEQEQQQQPQQFKANDIPLIRAGEADADGARKAELESKLDELAEQFDAGDLTTAEFLKAERQVNEQLYDLRLGQFRNELSQETTMARAEQSWNQSVEVFLNDHPEITKNNLRIQSFDAAIRAVTGDEKNVGMSDKDALELALKNWSEDLGITPTAAAAAAENPGKEVKAPKEPKPSAQDRPAAPNLKDLPAAAAADVDDGKFAALDRLSNTDPLAFEEQLASMPEALREEYLQFGG